MPLKQTHRGWQNEHLARYLLSQVAFISNPTMPGDDVGVDMICTLYETVKSAMNAQVLSPRKAIAIQIKSASKVWDVTKKGPYLQRLEIPYFVAVVTQKDLSLDLYSGRYITHFFSFRGKPRKLHFIPVDELITNYREGDDEVGYSIKLPRICKLRVSDSEDIIEANRQSILQESTAAQKAIASRQNREFIFDSVGGIEIFTGKDSAKVYLENYLLRFAEALHNISWIIENNLPVNEGEKEYFLDAYNRLSKSLTVPEYLEHAYDRLIGECDQGS